MIYLDNAATTMIDPRVFEVMKPWLEEQFGNPSSAHRLGREARVAVEKAREHVAALFQAQPSEIVFTGGGTESDTAAIMNALDGHDHGHIIISEAEHNAVHSNADYYEKCGFEVTRLKVGPDARVSVKDLREAILPDTRLISLMHVNNETGGINPLREIGEIAAGHDLLFHSDTIQSAAKLELSASELKLDYAAVTAHKIHGPKGCGALYVRNGLEFHPVMRGGAQERGRRGGTENVAGIVGFGEAARLAIEERENRMSLWRELRSDFLKVLHAGLDGCIVNGSEARDDDKALGGMPHILSISFPSPRFHVDAETMLMSMDLNGIAVSGGSACAAGSIKASHVMKALGHDDGTAKASVRVSFGAFTTRNEVERGAGELVNVVQVMAERSNLRSHSR